MKERKILKVEEVEFGKCSYCNGDGWDADDDDEGKTRGRRKCPQCKGTGKKFWINR